MKASQFIPVLVCAAAAFAATTPKSTNPASTLPPIVNKSMKTIATSLIGKPLDIRENGASVQAFVSNAGYYKIEEVLDDCVVFVHRPGDRWAVPYSLLSLSY